eukprot:CAMPEP_0182444864 /NCGR_PEP_ID=MMETSP1172-20130603/3175_1 /TAXON_ID=708627 /ORGANISM="Timspurckia oligopyrenoides, Strain CCMP3278" /LENGTH=725 /DNA_ID=CAMNT_0024640511 /DNA_START=35 /DNA_END=2212 /DNA_ORIENTATION=+
MTPDSNNDVGRVEAGDGRQNQLELLLEKAMLYSSFLSERIAEEKITRNSENHIDHAAIQSMDNNVNVEDTITKSSRKRTGRSSGSAKQAKEEASAKRLKSMISDADKKQNKQMSSIESGDQLTSNLNGFKQPVEMKGVELRDYQLAGIEWLVSLYENGLNGILADEMGLGKTLQSIGLLCYLRQVGSFGPFLIVAPLSVLHGWKSEIERAAPSVSAIVFHGSKEERNEIRNSITPRLNNPSAKTPILITSYELAMRERPFLSKFEWKYIIIDEGHRLKNIDCKLVNELQKYTSANRLLLTGTPLQNNLLELWSLLHYVLPEVFDDANSFQKWFNIEFESDPNSISEDIQGRTVAKLHSILRPFLLRRLKSQVVLELPRKKEIVLYCPLTSEQERYYHAARDGKLWDIIGKQNQKGSLSNRLMQMRKAANHPFLFEEDAADSSSPVAWGTDEQIVRVSGKMQLLDRLLSRLLEKNHKVLLFSQFTTMLDILQDYLELRSIEYARIDGSTPLSDRVSQMNEFNDTHENSKCKVFLLSTRSGGLGINLTSSDTVIFFDSDFNPQVDLQAMDRCHRIGQRKPVHCYRLISAGSVEEALLSRANEKRRMERLVVHKDRFHQAPTSLAAAQQNRVELTAQELRDVLQYNPAEAELGRKSKIISDTELDKLLDRSDMLTPNHSMNEPRNTKNKASKSKSNASGRLLDSLGGSSYQVGDGFEACEPAAPTKSF